MTSAIQHVDSSIHKRPLLYSIYVYSWSFGRVWLREGHRIAPEDDKASYPEVRPVRRKLMFAEFFIGWVWNSLSLVYCLPERCLDCARSHHVCTSKCHHVPWSATGTRDRILFWNVFYWRQLPGGKYTLRKNSYNGSHLATLSEFLKNWFCSFLPRPMPFLGPTRRWCT